MKLHSGSLLKRGEYRIEQVLGQGGFGITYIGVQVALNRKVVIKEFFMKEYCERDSSTSHVSIPSVGSRDLVERFRKKFVKEAQLIAGFNHPNIIRIYDIFEENDTAYYVMEYHARGSLSDLIKAEGKLAEKQGVDYVRQVAAALRYVHGKSVNHLDIKPGNILIGDNGEAVLIDFGTSKRYDATDGQETSTTPVGISHGYAPMEQYKKGGVSTFSPQTDIYALGATLYKTLTGEVPPEAMDISTEGLPPFPASLSASVCNAISSAMQPNRKDRPQTVDAFLSLLGEQPATPSGGVDEGEVADESTAIVGESVHSTSKPNVNINSATNSSAPKEKTSKKWSTGGIIAIILSVVILIFLFSLFFGLSEGDEPSVATDTLKVEEKINFAEVKENPLEDVVDKKSSEKERFGIEDKKNMTKNDKKPEEQKSAEAKKNDEKIEDVAPEVAPTEIEETSANDVDENEIFEVVEQKAEFPGGEQALLAYLGNNINYPSIAQENGIQGRVVVKFVVNTDGSICDVEVARSVDPSLDREAVRVVSSMPKWNPARQRGRAVRARYTVPIMFRLK